MMQDTLNYMFGLQRFGMRMGVEVTQKIMELLDNPHQKFKSIHVTGTNGKGSTCAYLASVLQKAGYKVGLYTSPHLVKFNERIQVSGKQISDEQVVFHTDKLLAKLEATNRDGGHIQPTFFEFITAIAFDYFAQENVEIAVVEVGLGGMLDATNVITPLVSVITNIGLDHTEILGDTTDKIAKDKAGIIKPGISFVTHEKDARILDYFKKLCAEKKSEIRIVHQEITPEALSSDLSKQTFKTTGSVQGEWTIPLLGTHQVENACTALVVLKTLQEQGISISDQAIREGMISTSWPGRLQIFSRKPLVIVDGTHNVEGMITLRDFVKNLPNKTILVLGIAKDKNQQEMVKLIAPLFKKAILTQGNFKPTSTNELAEIVRPYLPVQECPDIKEAVKQALANAQDNETILFTGSLYMIGDAMPLIEEELRKRNEK